MDGDDRRASQYGAPYHHTQHTGSRLPPTSQPMGPPSAADRYAQPGTPVRSDSVRHSMTRSSYLPGYSQQYGYPEQQYGSTSIHDSSPMQGVEMQYSPTAAYMQSARQSVGHQPSAQQYGGYQQSPMLSSSAQQAMYDPLPPFQQQQSRQSAAIEVMSSQLGAIPGHFDPQSTMQMSTTTSPYAQQQQHQSQQQQQQQHYSSASRQQSLVSQHHQQQTQQPYASSSSSDYPPVHDQVPSSQPSTSQQQQQQQQSTPSQSTPHPTPAEAEALLTGRATFNTTLATALQLIITASSSSNQSSSSSSSSTNLHSATDHLLTATRWLVTHIQPLGLHHDVDSPTKYAERLTLWTRLNLAWEGLAEALRMRVMVGLRQQQQHREGMAMSVVSAEQIRNLLNEIVGFANELEGYGLVDYELGLSEELIVAGLLGVLDLLEEGNDDGGEDEDQQQGGAGVRMRRTGDTAMGGLGVAAGVATAAAAVPVGMMMARSGI